MRTSLSLFFFSTTGIGGQFHAINRFARQPEVGLWHEADEQQPPCPLSSRKRSENMRWAVPSPILH